MIKTTEYHHSEALKELAAAKAKLNLMNQVRFWLLLALTMCHHQLSESLTALMISSRRGRTELTGMLLSEATINPDIREHVRLLCRQYIAHTCCSVVSRSNM